MNGPLVEAGNRAVVRGFYPGQEVEIKPLPALRACDYTQRSRSFARPPTLWVTEMLSELLMLSSCTPKRMLLPLLNPSRTEWAVIFRSSWRENGSWTPAPPWTPHSRQLCHSGLGQHWRSPWEPGSSLITGLSNLWSTLRTAAPCLKHLVASSPPKLLLFKLLFF